MDLAPEYQVLGASSDPTQCATSHDPLVISVNGNSFIEFVRAIPVLIYPLIVGVSWWRENAIRIELEASLILFSSPSGHGFIPLLTDVPLSEIISMVAGPNIDDTFLLLAVLGPYVKPLIRWRLPTSHITQQTIYPSSWQ